MPGGTAATAIRRQVREREVTTMPRLAEDVTLARRLAPNNGKGQ
jgi:hypothetical protein